ncbi:UNVERIFIED_CONTAM: hypothetical protein NCL1_45618 [Trichonephila clavipes]
MNFFFQVIEPPKNAKHPGKKGSFFYIYFFGSRQFGFVSSKNIFPFHKYHDKYFDMKNTNPRYIVGVTLSKRMVDFLRTEVL